MFQILHDINVDWMGLRKPLIAVSIAILLAGLISAIGRQMTPGGTDAFNLGVDFQGGTVVTAKFKQKPSVDEIQDRVEQRRGERTDHSGFDRQDRTKCLIKVPLIEGSAVEQPPAAGQEAVTATQVELGRANVKKALDTFGREAEPDPRSRRRSGTLPTRSSVPIRSAPSPEPSFATQAIIATLLGMVGILLFIAFRYDWTYAAGAVIAVFHDVLITLAFFSVFQWEVSLTVLAALLTLVGFSVNDSIVIFDRIRENLTLHRDKSLYQLTNDSINQTMSRTIVTNGLVFLVGARSCSFRRRSAARIFACVVRRFDHGNVFDDRDREPDRHLVAEQARG